MKLEVKSMGVIMKKITIEKLADDINDGLNNGDINHQEIITMFQDFIQNTLELKAEFRLTANEIQDLIRANSKLEKIKHINLNK